MRAASFKKFLVVVVSVVVVASIALTGGHLQAQHDSPAFVPTDWDAPIENVNVENVSTVTVERPTVPAHLIVVRFPAEMLAGLIDRTIDVTAPVKDVILGTPVTGVARLVGLPRVELSPSDEEAHFNVVVTGTVYSRTIGHAGQANIHGHSITRFIATKKVMYEPSVGFRSLPPTVVATTQCFTDSIAPTRGGIAGRIIQRRAGEQIAAQHSQLTAIARERATRRIATAFESRLNDRIVQLNQAVDFQVQLASLRDQEGARRLRARTTPKFLELTDATEPGDVGINLPTRQSTAASKSSVEIWVRSSLIPEKLGDALQTIFTNADQSAVLNTLALLPGTLGKEAATAITALAGERKVGVQSMGEWLVIDLNLAAKNTVAAQSTAAAAGSTRR